MVAPNLHLPCKWGRTLEEDKIAAFAAYLNLLRCETSEEPEITCQWRNEEGQLFLDAH